MNNLKADIIYENGQIATMTEKQPFVEAAAVSGGRIIRIGSSSLMEDIIDDSTEIFDLEGRYATPGFIETAESPVITAFGRGVMLPLFDDDSVDAVIDDIEGAVFEKQREGVNRCFGYGFSASLTEGKHACEQIIYLSGSLEGVPAFRGYFFGVAFSFLIITVI